MTTDSRQLLEKLTAYPHRGVGSKSNEKVGSVISQELQSANFSVAYQDFRTPPTYLPIVYWLIGGVILGLLTVQWFGLFSVILVTVFAFNGLLYFDWRPSLLLPPLITAKNIIGRYAPMPSLQAIEKPIYLINFDTLGSGQLKLITKTGSMTVIEYNNIVTETALELMQNDPRFLNVTTGSWHTADFDSAWFVRAGIPSVTLAALDEKVVMPNIHRPEDTLDHVDTRPMQQAIDLAVAVALVLDKKNK